MSSDAGIGHSITEQQQDGPVHPELSPQIVDALNSLVDHVSSAASAFACGSIISDNQLNMKDVTLFFKDADNIGSLDIPLSQQAIKDINNASQPSHHGVGEHTVYDPSYRQAKEITIPNFSLSPDPIMHAGILGLLQHKLVHSRPLRAELYKLNVYSEGGFFKPHRDTPRGETHIGTLLLSLPSTYTGGALVVRQNGREVFFDWSQSISLEWAFLYSDCEHEVLPVVSGHRVTIQYNIFDTPNELMAADPLVHADSRVDFLKSAIDTLLDANEALTLGFALRHEYPRDRNSSGRLDDLAQRLKGHDRVLFRVIEAKELSWEFRVVWKIADKDWRDRDYCRITWSDEYQAAEAQLKAADPEGSESWSDEYRQARYEMDARLTADYHARHNSRWALPFRHRCLTSEDYRTVDETYMEESLWSYLEAHNRAQARDDVLWICKPERYDDQVTYMAYGNEANTAYAYAALAIFVKLPSR